MIENRKIAILISGRGSNMLALMDAIANRELRAEIAIVISNCETAAGIAAARARGYRVAVIPHRGLSRAAHEELLRAELEKYGVHLICLAGYMRLLSADFLRAFPQRILNIHPSLLPAFAGLDAQAQALAYGVKITGCTVHFVDEECDHGAIILQSAVAVLPMDTVETLSQRILSAEHALYPRAVEFILNGKWKMVGRQVLPIVSN